WFVPHEHLDLDVTKNETGKNGSMLGSGAVIVMDETTDVVAAAERLVRFFAEESCGQCTPCREGTTWLDMILQRIMHGQGRPDDIGLLEDVSDNISVGLGWPPKQTTICPLGPSAVSPILSILKYFPEEIEAHIANSRVTPVTIGGGA
ncbi:MAG: NADH-quinone oxidoreductase subunit F, partial [Acidimicrobiia bacterium]|nr:NADH-quinone oxidoreductase subunit F [Acidimicrobiia bacterium]